MENSIQKLSNKELNSEGLETYIKPKLKDDLELRKDINALGVKLKKSGLLTEDEEVTLRNLLAIAMNQLGKEILQSKSVIQEVEE